MSILYERIASLCQARGVSNSKMCLEVGIQPSIMSDLKTGRKKGLSADTAHKIASYFQVSVGYLLGDEKTPTLDGERDMSDSNLKFALFGDSDMDDETLEEVRTFAKYVKERRKQNGEHP